METTETSLKNCLSQEAEYSDSFVGIHYQNGYFTINYPLGFTPIDLENNFSVENKNELEKQYRKDILKLISVLHYYKSKDRTKKESKEKFLRDDNKNFPLYSYIYIFNWYKKNGYYRPKEIQYKNGTKGKINWNRTIKQINPIVNNDNVVYLDFIVRKESYNEDELIAEINRFCVYESFKKIGCLFTNKMPKKEKIKVRNKLYLNVLKKKISSTFNDEERELFINMKNILESESNKNADKEYYYGTEYFNNIWESMIDDVYGIEKSSSEFLRPHVYWNIPGMKKKEFTLKPDTIMIPETDKTKNKIYILDAKYYKGGANLEDGSLPGGDSAIKQIVYAEKFRKNEKYKNYEIYNAFILPYDMQNTGLVSKLGETEEDWLKEEEKKSDCKYVKIQGIRMDTRSLLYKHQKANEKIYDELAEIIEKDFS